MERRIYAPAAGLDTWKDRLADPGHWVRTRSAFETAVFWELGARTARGLHPRLAELLDSDESLRDAVAIASFPEHRVALPGGSRASQTDVWAILRTSGGLVSLAVEGKAGETFGETVGDWRRNASEGKGERLEFLRRELGQQGAIDDALRYQLLHRTASAVLEAERIGAAHAVMLVLSFASDAASRADFDHFATSLRASGAPGSLLRAQTATRRPLILGWLDMRACTDAEIATIAV